ncbi:MAG: ATP-binding protein [Phycisphaerae bacterium]
MNRPSLNTALSVACVLLAALGVALLAWAAPWWVAGLAVAAAGLPVAAGLRRHRLQWTLDVQGRLRGIVRRYEPNDQPSGGVPDADLDSTIHELEGVLAEQSENSRLVQRAIARSNIELDQIFNAAGDAMRLIDADYNILQANENLAGLSYMGRNEVSGRKCYEVLSCTLCHTSRCPLKLVLDGQDDVTFEVEARRRGGTDVPCILTGAPYRSYDGRVLGIVESFKDITPLKRAQQKLQLYAQKLQRNYERMSELTDTAHRFVDLVAHEFRTPLTVVKEFTSIIADGLGGPVTDQQQEYLKMITASSDDLAQMVDDLLDSSRLKAGRLRLERRVHHPREVISGIWSITESKARFKNVRVVSEIAPDLPEVYIDLPKANRALVNLAINAIKFSRQESQIVLFARSTEDGNVELGVRDHGPGLTEEEVRGLFDRFHQTSHGLLSTVKGFGLGLSIVKEMVSLNFGGVDVQSTVGEGSTFSFVVPAAGVTHIVPRFLGVTAEECEDEQVLTVLCCRGGEDACSESVRAFLLETCRPMDLVLRGSEEGTVIAAGLTREPETAEGWITRLEEANDAARADETLETPPMIDFDVVAEFKRADFPTAANRLRQLTLDPLCAERL